MLYLGPLETILCTNAKCWTVHCHIAWHQGEGLALEIVEDEDSISVASDTQTIIDDTCTSWYAYVPVEVYPQDDSGI